MPRLQIALNLQFFPTSSARTDYYLPTYFTLYSSVHKAPFCHNPSSTGGHFYLASCSVSLASFILPFSSFLILLCTDNSLTRKAGSCDCGESNFWKNSKTASRRHHFENALPIITAHRLVEHKTIKRRTIRTELHGPTSTD